MSLHLLKLFVGAETLHELATHQTQRLEERRGQSTRCRRGISEGAAREPKDTC